MSNQDFRSEPVVTDSSGQVVPDAASDAAPACEPGGKCCSMRPVTLSLLAIVGVFLGGNVALLANPSLVEYLPTLQVERALGFASMSEGSCSSSDASCPFAAAALANCSASMESEAATGCSASSCSLTETAATPSCCETASRAKLAAFNCCASAETAISADAVQSASTSVAEGAESVAEAIDSVPPSPELPAEL